MITVKTHKFEDIKYECHMAALRAMDRVLSEKVTQRSHWIRDEELPALLPAIDRAIEAALLNAGYRAEEAA